ncbi:hypothetical protein PIB30_089547 [Stylosanthes scabra]|uniref:Uncharacterized protein n=1 Tax=Stylosanthes scabra TaxID=79078 RepID=A0ABU6WSF1_9FABA|nr:hypothetical protein [Stylosanthes scabra]
MAPLEILIPYFREAGFGHAVMLMDFHFDLALLSAFVIPEIPLPLMRRRIDVAEEGELVIPKDLLVIHGRLEEEERLLDQYESLDDDSPPRPSPPHPPPPPPPTYQQTGPDVVHEQANATWEQLTSTTTNDLWDVRRTSASVAHEIVQGFRQRTHHRWSKSV